MLVRLVHGSGWFWLDPSSPITGPLWQGPIAVARRLDHLASAAERPRHPHRWLGERGLPPGPRNDFERIPEWHRAPQAKVVQVHSVVARLQRWPRPPGDYASGSGEVPSPLRYVRLEVRLVQSRVVWRVHLKVGRLTQVVGVEGTAVLQGHPQGWLIPEQAIGDLLSLARLNCGRCMPG